MPNHHAHHPHFAGRRGLVAALGMALHKTGRARWAVELAGIQAGDVVVDIGCGPGNAARLAVKRGAARVIGVDPAAVMLRTARLLTRSRKVRYEVGTAENVPLSSDVASVVLTIAAVHHWSDVRAGLAEAQRVLNSGGRFVAVEAATVAGAHGHASHGWTDDQAQVFADMAQDAGFGNVRVKRHNVDHRDLIAVVAIA